MQFNLDLKKKSQKMPIVAALISRGTTILVEYGGFGTNFSTIARRLIESIPTTLDSKKSYSYEK